MSCDWSDPLSLRLLRLRLRLRCNSLHQIMSVVIVKVKKKLSDLSDDYHCDRTTLLMIVLAIPNFDSHWVSRLVHT